MVFEYAGKKSTELGLYIIGDSGLKDMMFGANPTINEDKTAFSFKPNFYSVSYDEPLEFTLQIARNYGNGLYYVPDDIWTNELRFQVADWFNVEGYQEFRMTDCDQLNQSSIVYNCIVTNPRRIDNGTGRGWIEVTFRCDGASGWHKGVSYLVDNSEPREFSLEDNIIDFSSEIDIDAQFNIGEICYPKIRLYINSSSFIRITNLSTPNCPPLIINTAGDLYYDGIQDGILDIRDAVEIRELFFDYNGSYNPQIPQVFPYDASILFEAADADGNNKIEFYEDFQFIEDRIDAVGGDPYTGFKLAPLQTDIFIDCENHSAVTEDGTSLMEFVNWQDNPWIYFVRGINRIKVEGNCIVEFTVDYPVSQ